MVTLNFRDLERLRELPAQAVRIICDGSEKEWPAAVFFHHQRGNYIEVVLRGDLALPARAWSDFIDQLPYWLVAGLYFDLPSAPASQERLQELQRAFTWLHYKTIPPA